MVYTFASRGRFPTCTHQLTPPSLLACCNLLWRQCIYSFERVAASPLAVVIFFHVPSAPLSSGSCYQLLCALHIPASPVVPNTLNEAAPFTSMLGGSLTAAAVAVDPSHCSSSTTRNSATRPSAVIVCRRFRRSSTRYHSNNSALVSCPNSNVVVAARPHTSGRSHLKPTQLRVGPRPACST
ncbi:hypothetical protein BDW22DRAFT_1364601 [Trametopsis cervina]|nr:hypothetical protein BDW22DRAFT_1364601 [Trametopsis cervina]